MFSLIITLISIALVAALAIATLYYGGTSWGKGGESARAAQIMTQGQQVLGAADTFRAERGRWPNSMEEMVAEKYLKEIPSLVKEVTVGGDAGVPGLGGIAHAAGESTTVAWTMPTAGRPTFVLDSAINAEVCKLVNEKSRGDNGILKKASTTLASQCFGEFESALTVVVTREAQGLTSALPAEKVSTAGLPTTGGVLDASSAAWLVSPGAGSGVTGLPTEGAPGNAASVFTVEVIRDPYGEDASLSLNQQGTTVNVLATTGANSWGLLKVTNSSTDAVVFPFSETSNFFGFTEMSYLDGGDADRAEQIAYIGYQYCEEGGTLPAGGSCVISIDVPDRCSSKYTEQQGPLSFVVTGPSSCPPSPAGLLSFGNLPQLQAYINQFGQNDTTPGGQYVQIRDGYGGAGFSPRLDQPMAATLSMTLPATSYAQDSAVEFVTATATVSGPGLSSATYPMNVTYSKGNTGDSKDGIFYLEIPVPGSPESGTSFSTNWQMLEVTVTYRYHDRDEGITTSQTVNAEAPIVMADYAW